MERDTIFGLVGSYEPFTWSLGREHGFTACEVFLSLSLFRAHKDTHSGFSRKTPSMLHQHWVFFVSMNSRCMALRLTGAFVCVVLVLRWFKHQGCQQVFQKHIAVKRKGHMCNFFGCHHNLSSQKRARKKTKWWCSVSAPRVTHHASMEGFGALVHAWVYYSEPRLQPALMWFNSPTAQINRSIQLSAESLTQSDTDSFKTLRRDCTRSFIYSFSARCLTISSMSLSLSLSPEGFLRLCDTPDWSH